MPDPVESVKALLPQWLRNDDRLMAIWEEGVAEVGYENALAWVRQSSVYAETFPGMMRDDGTQRFNSENDYLALIESYERDLISVGINPDVMRHQFVNLIIGDVSADEFWSERVKPMYDRVIAYGDDLMARYAADYGIEMTPEALIAAALDPDLETKIFEKRIALTEIKAESDRVFGMVETNRWSDLMGEIQEHGKLTASEAQAFFQRAGHMIPTLEVLTARHNDPDDEFNLEQFTNAMLFEDPSQVRRMRRLQAQESALFNSRTSIQRNQQGALTGLVAE